MLDGRPYWRRPLDTQTGQKVYNLCREEMGKLQTDVKYSQHPLKFTQKGQPDLILTP